MVWINDRNALECVISFGSNNWNAYGYVCDAYEQLPSQTDHTNQTLRHGKELTV